MWSLQSLYCVTSVIVLSAFSGWGSAQSCPAEVRQLSGDGWSVALEQSVLVYGSPDLDDGRGVVYVSRNNGSVWGSQVSVVAGDRAVGDHFGNSLAISDNLMIVGAPQDDDFGNNSGSAYIFRFDELNEVWNQVEKLHAFDSGSNDHFGGHVSISGSRVIISAERDDDNGTNSGSAYIYKNTGTGWVLETKILATDGQEYDSFGICVSISDTTAIVGASDDDDSGNSSGSAYVFEFDGLQWVQSAKLIPSDGGANDFFGEAVVISGDRVLIGSQWDDDLGPNAGAAYIFQYDGLAWIQQAKLLAFDGSPNDQFGYSVSLSADRAIVGANKANGAAVDSGSAYIFEFDGIQWVELNKLHPELGNTSDQFAKSVSICNEFAVVGADQFTHLFDLTTGGPGDLNFDAILNFFDISIFIQAFVAQDSIADFNNDGIFNFFDISTFIAAFSEGCQ